MDILQDASALFLQHLRRVEDEHNTTRKWQTLSLTSCPPSSEGTKSCTSDHRPSHAWRQSSLRAASYKYADKPLVEKFSTLIVGGNVLHGHIIKTNKTAKLSQAARTDKRLARVLSGTPKYGLQSAVVPDHASESHVDSRPETWFPNTRRPPDFLLSWGLDLSSQTWSPNARRRARLHQLGGAPGDHIKLRAILGGRRSYLLRVVVIVVQQRHHHSKSRTWASQGSSHSTVRTGLKQDDSQTDAINSASPLDEATKLWR